jgi:hypothetical protein
MLPDVLIQDIMPISSQRPTRHSEPAIPVNDEPKLEGAKPHCCREQKGGIANSATGAVHRLLKLLPCWLGKWYQKQRTTRFRAGGWRS